MYSRVCPAGGGGASKLQICCSTAVPWRPLRPALNLTAQDTEAKEGGPGFLRWWVAEPGLEPRFLDLWPRALVPTLFCENRTEAGPDKSQ